MFSRQIEQLARQHHAELVTTGLVTTGLMTTGSNLRSAGQPRKRPRTGSAIRRNTGWAIVSVGLRIAESGNR